MLIEAHAWKKQGSSFITLTYNDEHLPPDGNLHKEELQKYLDRVRKARGPFRYFACGEYGEENLRPHFHLIMFGVNAWTTRDRKSLTESWSLKSKSKGFVFFGSVTAQSLRYVASYVQKRNLSLKDPRLAGRTPEFRIMSLRPGIGALGIGSMLQAQKVAYEKTGYPMPVARVPGMGMVPFGRYVFNKVLRELGINRLKRNQRLAMMAVQRQLEKEAQGWDEQDRVRAAQVEYQAGRLIKNKRRRL